MKDILSLATAALKPGQMPGSFSCKYPRVDYMELKHRSGVDVLDYDAYQRSALGKPLRYIETQMRSDIYLAWLGLLSRRNYRMIFAWSERVGIPYAGAARLHSSGKPFLAMFTCWSKRQEMVITRLNLFEVMDGIAVHCQSMKDHFLSLGVPEQKIKLIHYSIDQRFFSPEPGIQQQPRMVLSLGEIRSRDYPGLFRAVDGLPMTLLVAASGAWYAREKDTVIKTAFVPSNVKISGGFPLLELKKLYAQSQFVVLPLYDQVYSAGATAALEAMSMARAVLAFDSRGIRDYVLHGETGLLVEPGDVDGMRDAIRFLLEHPEEARRMGDNARQRVDAELNLERYVSNIIDWLKSYLS